MAILQLQQILYCPQSLKYLLSGFYADPYPVCLTLGLVTKKTQFLSPVASELCEHVIIV